MTGDLPGKYTNYHHGGHSDGEGNPFHAGHEFSLI